nr:hypothetical protein [Tanacetum cinerariifolium]
ATAVVACARFAPAVLAGRRLSHVTTHTVGAWPASSAFPFQLSQFLRDARGGLFAHQLLTDLALVVDDVRHRQRLALGQVVLLGRVLRQHGELDAQCVAGGFQVFTLQVVEIDPEHADLLAAHLLGEFVQFRDFRAARATPFRPVVDHQPMLVDAVAGDLLTVL